MTAALTERQTKILADVKDFIAQKGYSPTVRELADLQGMSVAGVFQQLRRMRDAGVVDWVDGMPRTLRIVKSGRGK